MRKFLLALILIPNVLFAQPFGGDRIKVWDGSKVASVLDTGSNDSLQCAIVDASGNQITTFGAADGATETTLQSILTELGQKTEPADSQTVTGTLACTQSGAWNIGDITGTVSLPTGAATAANQTTMIGHIDGIEGILTTIDTDTGGIATSAASIDSKITACNTGAVTISALPNEGQQTMANSISVGIASNQSAIPVTQSGTWDEVGINDSGNSITVDVGTALPAGTNSIGTVIAQPGQLVYLTRASSDVDNSAILVFDCSGANSSSKFITVTNAGEGDLYCTINDATPVADGSTADYDWKLAKGQTEWIPVAYKSASTDNDIYCLRAAAQTNDNVLVTQYGWAN